MLLLTSVDERKKTVALFHTCGHTQLSLYILGSGLWFLTLCLYVFLRFFFLHELACSWFQYQQSKGRGFRSTYLITLVPPLPPRYAFHSLGINSHWQNWLLYISLVSWDTPINIRGMLISCQVSWGMGLGLTPASLLTPMPTVTFPQKFTGFELEHSIQMNTIRCIWNIQLQHNKSN